MSRAGLASMQIFQGPLGNLQQIPDLQGWAEILTYWPTT